MIREKITNTAPITGIIPFNELPIDADIWRKAHEYHDRHRLLHSTTFHRPGIVYGLEVVAGPNSKLVVAPGMAVDSEGRSILLQEPLPFKMDEKGQFYVLISYKKPLITDTAVQVGGGEKHYGFQETREVKPTKDSPSPTSVELARIYRSAADAAVKDADDPFDPGSDEINLLHRVLAFPHCYADISVGELSYVPKAAGGGASDWKPNRAGLFNLLQEGNGRGFHMSFAGPVNLTSEKLAPELALLYVSGKQGFQPLSAEQIEGLGRFLARGGMLFGDSCGGEEFPKAFEELVSSLGKKLKSMDKKHPLLTAHHIFSSPPAGCINDGKIMVDSDDTIVLSTHNYGGAWQGDLPKADASDARERIRESVEFGLNVCSYAAKRYRMRVLDSVL